MRRQPSFLTPPASHCPGFVTARALFPTRCGVGGLLNKPQGFSRAGVLSEPGMDPGYLENLVMISGNKKACKPSVDKSKDK